MNRNDLETAKAKLADRYWEYAYALSKLQIHKEVPGLGTMMTDQYWRVYWDPALDWDDVETQTVLFHEFGHALGEHADRGMEIVKDTHVMGIHDKNLDPYVWNLACDAEINDGLERLPWVKFPAAGGDVEARQKAQDEGRTGGIFPRTIGCADDHPAETYYVHLTKNRPQDGEPEPGFGEPGEGDGDGQPGQGKGEGEPQPGQGGGQGDLQDADGQGQPMTGQNPAKPTDGDHKPGRCGSVADGQPKPWEDARDDDCMDSAEKESVLDETMQRIMARTHGDQSATQGIGSDALPPMLLDPDKVAEKVNHKLWLDTLQREIYQHLTHSHRTWEMPHRRIPGLPGKRRFPRQAVLIADISGSINSLAVQREFELANRLYGRGLELHVIACDTQAHVVTDRTAVYSGGGTALGAGVQLAQEKFPNAGVIIVITDGYTGWECERKKAPVVVMSWGRPGPDWAKSIPMPGLTPDQPDKPTW